MVAEWFSSERREESHIPVSFWYLSLAGSDIVLAYAMHKIDPVFIAGQSVGTVVYVRNLILLYRAKKRAVSG